MSLMSLINLITSIVNMYAYSLDVKYNVMLGNSSFVIFIWDLLLFRIN